MNAQPPFAPQVGRVARDTQLQRIGLVLSVEGELVRLRALTNGRVWEAPLPSVRGVSNREELSLRLAAVNARTLAGLSSSEPYPRQ
ncbi:hypothetical protein OG552_23720 [Streptomyces sp. NBC_01476]|uniref:hypothetical protein n=1 Tax=Streptomyces sp. NBC_01476 TaxID=2903881 RepID=UPI002E2F7A20|nr:hypothetical protein [Streptomyces sp. NBC_01476]